MITVTILKAAEPGNTEQYYQSILGGMRKYAAAYKINSGLRVSHFLAQIAHESGLRMVEENGNYSAERMHHIFVERPELLTDSIDYGVESAFYFWDSRALNAAADADDVIAVTRLVNGGNIGLIDRKARLARIRAAM